MVILSRQYRLLFMVLVTILPACVSGQSAVALAADRFTIALVPEQNVYQQRQRYGIIATYLSRHLDMDVRIVMVPSYGKMSEAFLNGGADAGFFGSFSYILARARAGVEPVCRPVWLDGSSTYSGYIFVRKDSGIRSVEDMQKKRLVLVDKATTAGYIFQQGYFRNQGIADMGDYFHAIYFAGGHDAAAWAVYTGEADVGGAKNHIYHALEKEYPDFKEKMVVLARSPAVPSNGMVVRGNLDSYLKKRLQELLIGLEHTQEGRLVLAEFGARRFVENRDEDYQPVYKMAEDLGLDLATYHY